MQRAVMINLDAGTPMLGVQQQQQWLLLLALFSMS